MAAGVEHRHTISRRVVVAERTRKVVQLVEGSRIVVHRDLDMGVATRLPSRQVRADVVHDHRPGVLADVLEWRRLQPQVAQARYRIETEGSAWLDIEVIEKLL